MLIGFHDSFGGAAYPLHKITSIGREQDPGDGKALYREVRFEEGKVGFRLYGRQYENFVARPAQLIPSEPGCRLIRAEDGQSWSEPLIGWALCLDGEIRPVTANGVLGGSSPSMHSWVQMPDSSVQAVGEYTEPCSFDSVADMVAHFTPKSAEPDPWPAAEEALRAAQANLDARPEDAGDDVFEPLAAAWDVAIHALLHLPATTSAQAIRKIEVAMFTPSVPRGDVDFPALIAEAKRVAARS